MKPAYQKLIDEMVGDHEQMLAELKKLHLWMRNHTYTCVGHDKRIRELVSLLDEIDPNWKDF